MSQSSTLFERARNGLNRLADRINQFEDRGGLAGAIERSAERVRLEQMRIRQAAMSQGPIAYLAKLRQAYARLEVPFGSDRPTVRAAYRSLMRRYHPDRHASDPERERIATEISQRLTVAYELVNDYLDR